MVNGALRRVIRVLVSVSGAASLALLLYLFLLDESPRRICAALARSLIDACARGFWTR